MVFSALINVADIAVIMIITAQQSSLKLLSSFIIVVICSSIVVMTFFVKKHNNDLQHELRAHGLFDWRHWRRHLGGDGKNDDDDI